MCGIGFNVTCPPWNAVVSPPIFAASECAPSWQVVEKRKTIYQITPRIRNCGVISAALGMLAHRLEPHRLLRKFYSRELRWIYNAGFITSMRGFRSQRGPGQSVHDPSIRSRRTASANARKSRSRVSRGTLLSMQLWAISASPRRPLRRFASTFARNSPARCQ